MSSPGGMSINKPMVKKLIIKEMQTMRLYSILRISHQPITSKTVLSFLFIRNNSSRTFSIFYLACAQRPMQQMPRPCQRFSSNYQYPCLEKLDSEYVSNRAERCMMLGSVLIHSSYQFLFHSFSPITSFLTSSIHILPNF